MSARLLLHSTFVLFLTMSQQATALEFSLGLNTEDVPLREKPAVLIYLSNDRMAPLPDSKMAQTIQWMRSALHGIQYYVNRTQIGLFTEAELGFHNGLSVSDKAFFEALAEYSSKDTSESATGIEHLHTLKNVARANPKYDIGFVAFRNFFLGSALETTRPIQLAHYAPGSGKDSWPLHNLDSGDYPPTAYQFPYSDQPLSHPAVFERILTEALALYPKEKFRHVLVIKSQGGRGMALTPRYQVHPETELSHDKFLTAVLAQKAVLLQGEVALPAHRGTNSRLSHLMSELAGKKEEAGISTKEVMAILGRSKANFPLVFFDVNELEFTDELKEKGSFPNIGTVFYTNKPAPYGLVDYGELFSHLGVTTTDFEVRFREFLRVELAPR